VKEFKKKDIPQSTLTDYPTSFDYKDFSYVRKDIQLLKKTGWTAYYNCSNHFTHKCGAKLTVHKKDDELLVTGRSNAVHSEKCATETTTADKMVIHSVKSEMETLLKRYAHDMTATAPVDIAETVLQEIKKKYEGL